MSAKEVIRPKSWPRWDYTFSPAVRKGDYLYISGCSASQYDPSLKKVVCKGGVVDQARATYEKIKLILEAAGASFDDVVRTNDYVSPEALAEYRYTGRVRREYFTSTFPAATGVIVEKLVRPDQLIEVECVAVVGKTKKEMISFGHPRYQKLTYREGVRKGDLLNLSGIGPFAMTEAREMIGLGDIAAQTRQIYVQAKKVLEAAGGSFDDVVKTVDYITPEAIPTYRYTGRVRREFFTNTFPAATGIVINQLLHKEQLIEVDFIAMLGKTKKEMISFGHPRYQKLTYREGVRKGDLLFVSGIGPFAMTEAREMVGAGDIVAQTRQIYVQAKRVLEAAGLGFDDVVKTVDYITPDALADYRKTAGVRREYFTGTFPAATSFVVNQLLKEKQLIEVDFIAVAG